MRKIFWILLSALIVCLDQWTKYWVVSTLMPYQSLSVCSILNITLAYNTGAAFSFLSDTGLWHQWFFAGFSLLMGVFLLVWLLRTPDGELLQSISLSFVLGGAIGNLIDRALQGRVVDFIDFHYKHYHFATFNLADSAICLGTAILLFTALFIPSHVKAKI